MSARRDIVPGLVVAILLAACGGGGDSADEPPPPPPPPPPDPTVTLNVTRVFAGLPDFSSPLAMLQAPGDNTRWFVVEQPGRVRVFENTPTVSTTRVFIDITDRVDGGGEMGLLGMAFHPAFPTDPRVFLSYTNTDAGRVSRVSSFDVETDGMGQQVLDPDSERILLTMNQPETNHNGGGIAFGPDGNNHLYIGSGDGGGSNDQHGNPGNGQRLTTLLGKMLRIDVGAAGSTTYSIPADNPFAGNTLCGVNGTGPDDCPEIYAWGLRNPWRWSFDRQGGQLWAADVGQNAREEVNRIERGSNYGWRCFEGTLTTGNACSPAPQDPQSPVAEYGRDLGRSITGGYVYRGTGIAGLAGRYVFGDFITGRIWHIPADTQPTLTVTGGFQSGLSISSFAEGTDGELYVVDHGGELYRLGGS
jgi:glucose/arabinose dehydrogenase